MAAAVLGSVGLAAAPAATAAGCAASGVSVVVDAGATGGTSTRCASGDPGSGLAALSSAGHAYTFVPRQPGFVCTIDRAPDPCNGAPASAYWSYWHARPGGSWTYSTLGAGSFDPPAGSVEGWAFGSGAPPGVRPPAIAPRPTPAPTTPGATPSRSTPPRPSPSKTTAPRTTAPRTTAPQTSAPQTSAPGPARTTTAPQPTATARPPVTPAATPPADTPTTKPTPTDSTVVADPASSPGSGSGGPTGPALVGALVLVLGGGAALLTRRRRSP